LMKKAGSQGWNGGRSRAEPRAGSRNRKALWLAVLLVAGSSRPPRARAQSSGTSEYAAKAAFLFHFAQFVEWPADAFKDRNSPLTYCTIGEDPFRGALDESVKGKNVGGRPLRVQHLREREEIDGCQVVFIAAALRAGQGEELAGAQGRPVLIVGETEHFAQEGGVIGFCLEEKKIRFEINLEAAGKARLRISAKLLALAKTVLGNPRGD
jgi:YfiR/HmsC-like